MPGLDGSNQHGGPRTPLEPPAHREVTVEKEVVLTHSTDRRAEKTVPGGWSYTQLTDNFSAHRT